MQTERISKLLLSRLNHTPNWSVTGWERRGYFLSCHKFYYLTSTTIGAHSSKHLTSCVDWQYAMFSFSEATSFTVPLTVILHFHTYCPYTCITDKTEFSVSPFLFMKWTISLWSNHTRHVVKDTASSLRMSKFSKLKGPFNSNIANVIGNFYTCFIVFIFQQSTCQLVAKRKYMYVVQA